MKKNSRKNFFEELEFRTLLDRILKNRKRKLPFLRLLYKAISLDFFAGENTDEPKKIQNLTRLEDLDFDYQLLDSEEKINDFLQIIVTKEFFQSRYGNHRNRPNYCRTGRNELQILP